MKKKRCETIGEILTAMRVLRLRMLNSMEPLGILLRKSDSALFRELGNGLWEGIGPEESWWKIRCRAHGRDRLFPGLVESELKLLDEFFRNVGKSGREGQAELFASVIDEMENAQASARARYADASKLYTALGTLLGIALCVLAI